MKLKIIITLLLTGILLPTIGLTPTAHAKRYKKGFLYREGTQLMLNGKPYSCASFNSFQFCGCGHDYELFSDEELEKVFASLPKNMILRTWAFPSYKDNVDKLIRLAEKYDLKLILSLVDGRSSCGNFDGAPNGDGSGKTEHWYREGYRKEYIPHVIEMTSKYKDSPAIAMWEIINEPGDVDWRLIRNLLHEVAALIKKHDPNHLVETGAFAGWAYDGYANYKALHDSPHIDVGNLHEYDYDYQNSNTIESPHFEPCLKVMTELNKVLIVGETGIISGDDCRTSLDKRAEAMREKFDVYLGMGAGGVFVWNFAKERRGCNLTFDLKDPMLKMMIDYQKANYNKK